MAQTNVWFSGVETGDASELNLLNAGASVQGTTVRTGAYALKVGTNFTVLKTGLAATQSVIRMYLRIPAIPSGNVIFLGENADSRLSIFVDSSGKLNTYDPTAALGLSVVTGTKVLSNNTWYRIEVALDLAAGGVVKIWVDGALDVSTTHTTNASGTPTNLYQVQGDASTNEFFFDDMMIATGGVAAIGGGQCIARQGIAGTPTYNAWTKNGAATAALCWSDTPYSAGTNCSDAVLSDAQTMLVAKFSTVQPGHGTETIATSDTINACKVAMIAKTAVAGNIDIRRRYGGADTNVTKAMSTSDAYYDTGIFTTTTANLDAAEIGVANDLIATTETVEDMWFIVDFIYNWTPPQPLSIEGLIRPLNRIIAY